MAKADERFSRETSRIRDGVEASLLSGMSSCSRQVSVWIKNGGALPGFSVTERWSTD